MMKVRALLLGLVCGVVCAAMAADKPKTEEASGMVTNTTHGAFQLQENDVLRQFNLSRADSVYEPATWYPACGDKVNVSFVTTSGVKSPTLKVLKIKLVTPGPDTLTTPLTSPAVVEVVLTGHQDFIAKVPTGQHVKFLTGHRTKSVPEGLVLAKGEKIKIEFRTEKAFSGFGFNHAVDKIEKINK